jgi:flavin-dependent dehydrogenase
VVVLGRLTRRLPEPHSDATRTWTIALAETEHTRLRARGTTLAAPISVHGAQTGFLTPLFGSGWIAIGDAAWSSDPLAGIGILDALQSARSAARVVDSACAGDEGLMAEYVQTLNVRIDGVLAQLLDGYRQEVRWADRAFWRRRHAAPHRIAPITLFPDALVRLTPSSTHRPALGLAPEQVATLLALAPTPRSAVSVLREFTTRCAVDDMTALRALQAFAEVVDTSAPAT